MKYIVATLAFWTLVQAFISLRHDQRIDDVRARLTRVETSLRGLDDAHNGRRGVSVLFG